MWLDNSPTFTMGINHIHVIDIPGPFGASVFSGPSAYQIYTWQNCLPQVVRAMLESSMKERQTQRIQLNDTPREAVSLLLEILLLGLECFTGSFFVFLKKLSLFESKVEKCELFVYLALSGVKHVMVGAEISVDNQTSDQYSG